MIEVDLPQVVRAFLEANSTLALATVNADGQPECAPVYFVSDDTLNLYWLSSITSRHSVNIASRPAVAATIYPAVWGWEDICGLQIEGTAQPVRDDRVREQVLVLYLRKFQLPEALDAAITSSTVYVLRPTWVRWLDNSISFGYKAELNL
jgi:uncharacterized protein YhbP (UPF0306 family)